MLTSALISTHLQLQSNHWLNFVASTRTMSDLQLNTFQDTSKVHYTTHHNWSWVVTEALHKLSGHTDGTALVHCDRFRDLPSSQSKVKVKPSYALFRLDIVWRSREEGELSWGEVRTRSDIFGFLDPKDSLTRVAQLLDAMNCMPDTMLIPWNWLGTAKDADEGGAIDVRQKIVNMLSNGPKLLKAPLGSGGFGLYFVYCCEDVEEIIRCHRIKAEEKEGFMQDLCSTFYGFNTSSELAWSLQDVISGVRVPSPAGCDHSCGESGEKSQIVAEIERRRCQVRAYVVMINSALYLYTTYEVRLPCWNIDLDATLAGEYALYNNTVARETSTGDGNSTATSANWSNELENEYCGQGHGRPYNEHRNKGQTERYLLSELPELKGSEHAVTQCMMELFTKLKPVLQYRQRANASQYATPGQEGLGHIFDASAILAALQDAPHNDTQISSATTQNNRAEVAIVGVDLVLSYTTNIDAVQEQRCKFSAKIVEINNNPAMPAEGKNMSALYREHLVDFVSGTVALAAAVVRAQRLGQSPVVVDASAATRFTSI